MEKVAVGGAPSSANPYYISSMAKTNSRSLTLKTNSNFEESLWTLCSLT